MRSLFNHVMRRYFLHRHRRIVEIKQHSTALQHNILQRLLRRASHTEYGRKYDFGSIQSYDEYIDRVPLTDYEGLRTYIRRQMNGEENILWPGRAKWYAKSSGTTDRSKYIPMTEDSYHNTHTRAGWDSSTLLYQCDPACQLFSKKTLLMGGSLSKWKPDSDVYVGDVSAILINRLPPIGRPFFTPSFETALLDDWEAKINRMAEEIMLEDLTMLGGVPTWTMVLLDKVLELTGKQHMLEVWPNARYYVHGGVGFDPYRPQFKGYFPSEDFQYFEVYNASEGYFAMSDTPDSDGMLLLTNNDIFYEFITIESMHSERPESVPLAEVELNKNYALAISTSAGLWRYLIGDTISFTHKNPYRIKVTGRTKHFINVFGEEVMVGNAEEALQITMDQVPATINNFTVGPIFLEKQKRGGHEWVIEFEDEPRCMHTFSTVLDENLQRLNSDYAAKRFKNLALDPLTVRSVPKGTFISWMKRNNKVGGQHKVPRLYNSRKYIDELLNTSVI